MKQSVRPLLASALMIAGGVLPVAAESYCVACYGPDAVYRCVVADAPATAAPDPRNQVQCIKQLAKAGGHSRCSVERFSAAGCNGPERIISPSASALPVAPTHAASPDPALQSSAGGAATKNRKSSDGSEQLDTGPAGTDVAPPQTVEELAKSTVATTKKSIDSVTGSVKSSTEQAGEKIGDVGSTIGHAAKKSWNCLTSLFNDC